MRLEFQVHPSSSGAFVAKSGAHEARNQDQFRTLSCHG